MTRAADIVVAVNLLDAHSLLAAFGAVGVFVILVAETGLLVGVFLPGDSLLFTAGVLCATAATSPLHLSLPVILIAAVSGALVGAQLGYLIGAKAGPALLDRDDRPRLRRAAHRAQESLEHYGAAKAIVLARFIPVIRTVLNPLAGALGVPVRTFTVWQVVGGVIWSAGVTVAGYALGTRVPNVDRYLLPIVAVVVVASLIPVLLEVRRQRAHRSREA